MATVKGIWEFYALAPFTAPSHVVEQAVTFTTAEGDTFAGMQICPPETAYPILLDFGFGTDSWTVAIYNGETEFRFVEETKRYQTVDFGTEQSVSEEFYALLCQMAYPRALTLSEKLVRIAENERRVYEAGYKAGREAAK